MTAITGSNDNDPLLEESTLSSSFTRDGITVAVKIYRLAGEGDGWTLEVVTPKGNSIVWQDTFATDGEAYRTFYLVVENEGVGTFLAPEGARH